MKKIILSLFLISSFSVVWAKDTMFLGPTNMRVSESGDFSRVETAPKQDAFDNLWAYRLFPTNKKLTGKGVFVAVADSGITSHPEFNGKNIQGQDFTMSGFMTDIKNHGTGVAGVIAARGLRFTGVAPEAKIFVYKIDDGSRLVGPQAATAALNAIFTHNENNPDQRISVINLSYGSSGGGNVPLTNAINRLHDSGVVIICPVGNDGFPGVHYPANLSTTFAVGALASDQRNVYSRSTFGPQVDFIAPGDRVYTTSNDGDYVLMSGSSVAAGFVTAAAALAVEGFKNKNGRYPTVSEVKDVLKSVSEKLAGVPDIKQGNGIINIKKLEEKFK